METDSGKFLVQLLNRFDKQQLFFMGWLLVVMGFVVLMSNFRRSQTRRNFRDTPYKPKSKGIVKRGSTLPDTAATDDDLPARKTPHG